MFDNKYISTTKCYLTRLLDTTKPSLTYLSYRELAPELLNGAPYSVKTDIYSLCAVITYIQEELKLNVTEEVLLGVSEDPQLRPTARAILSSLITERS